MRIYINEDKSEYLAHFHERRKTINDEIREKVKDCGGCQNRMMLSECIPKCLTMWNLTAVTDEEIESAKIDKDLRLLFKSKDNIFTFHERELEKSWKLKGKTVQDWYRVYGIQRVGVCAKRQCTIAFLF